VRNTEHNNTSHLFVVRNPINIKVWLLVKFTSPCVYLL